MSGVSSQKLETFFCSSFITLVHSGLAHYFQYAKKFRFFCGGPFLWGPLFGRACWTCLNSPLNTIQPNPGNPVPTTGYPVPKPGNKSTHYLIRSRLIVGSALDMLSVFVLDRCLQVGETSSFHRNLHQFFAAKLFWTMSADICLFVDGVSRVTWICLSTSRLGRINHSLQFRHHAAMLRHLQQHVVAPSGNAVIQKCERKMVRNIKLQFH